MNIENCPKCDTKLSTLSSSGRQICPSCKWMSQLENKQVLEENNLNKSEVVNENTKDKFSLLSERAKANNSEMINSSVELINHLFDNKSSIDVASKILSISGLVVMLFGGIIFDTTTCDGYGYSESCTHNIGLLNTRSNIVNIGGFLCVSGCILFGKSR